MALKSAFSLNFDLVPLKTPWPEDSRKILAGQTVVSFFMKSFLYVVSKIKKDRTVLVHVIRIFFFFLDDFYLLREVFRIRLREEATVCGIAKPVAACFQLIWVIGIIIFFWLFLLVFIGISALASQGEVTASVLIGGLDVLIVSLVAWEMGRI